MRPDNLGEIVDNLKGVIVLRILDPAGNAETIIVEVHTRHAIQLGSVHAQPPVGPHGRIETERSQRDPQALP